MWHELGKRARGALLPVLLSGLTLYLGYHSLHGDHGLVAWLKVAQQIDSVSTELSGVSAKRARLERRVRLLRPDSLDLDLLEERARAVLGLGRGDERVIFVRPEPEEEIE